MRHRLGRITTVAVVVMMAVTVLGALATRTAVTNQENKLLRERTNEIGLVFTSAITALPGTLNVLGGVLRATHNSPAAFEQASAAAQTGSTGTVTFALIKQTSSGFRVVLAEGTGLNAGQVIRGDRAEAFRRAMTTAALVPTGVIGSGADRSLGFAIGAPVAPDGTVLYRQTDLGPVGPPRQAATTPFSELNVALYASARPDPSEVLVETAKALPLQGRVRSQPLTVGAATWTLQTSAVHPLVGKTTTAAPWIVLGSGLLLSLLVGATIEAETRRRKNALALYESEHRVAETLQRSLLPVLPTVADLDLAARYLPGAADQEVGGDWFDVFTIEDGRLGVVIGDVVGHDIAAAAAMSQIQASLRAFAWRGGEPHAVLDHLDALIARFEISELATVFFGLLGPPELSGARTLTYANAGHLPPLIRHLDGRVEEIDDAGSVLLGAPSPAGLVRDQAQITLPAGAVLLLFTDGLVEAPGRSITDSLADLSATLSAAPTDVRATDVCDLVLANVDPARLRDDIAVLVLRMTGRVGTHAVVDLTADGVKV